MAPWATADDRDAAFALGVAIIGSGVRAGRRRAHLTQQQLGWLVAVSQSAISRLETGTLQGMRLRTLARIVAEPETRSAYQFPDGPPPEPWELQRALRPAADPKDLEPSHDADGHATNRTDLDAGIQSYRAGGRRSRP
jgi:hypothetical protein